MSYTDPSTGNDDKAVQDLSGNDAPSFTDQPVAEPMADNDLPKADRPGRHLQRLRAGDDPHLEHPSATGGSAITGYRVERSTDNKLGDLEEANSTTT